MNQETFSEAVDHPFFVKVLCEAFSFLPDEANAVYVEPLFGDGGALSGGVAVIVRGKRLHLVDIDLGGEHRDDEQEALTEWSLPVDDLVIERRLERTGWSRDEDVRQMTDSSFAGAIRVRYPLGRFGTQVPLPLVPHPKGIRGRHTRKARTFLDELSRFLSQTSA